MMRILVIFLFVLVGFQSYSQVPIINQFEPITTFPYDTIIITGAGFDADKTKIEVWFGSVEGEIISSTSNSIEVVVPMQARVGNIEVVHKTSRLSGKSLKKFVSSYEGASAFDATKFVLEKSVTSNGQLYDLCTCDFDGDKKPDLVSTKYPDVSSIFEQSPNDIMVLQNTSVPGTINFNKFDKTNLAVLDLDVATDNVTCGDLQGDGLPEIVVTRADGSTKNEIFILKNTSTVGSINFATETVLEIGVDGVDIAAKTTVRDLNGDGKPELLVTNSTKSEFYVFLNQSSAGNLSFAAPVKFDIKIAPTDNLTAYDIDVQDFDNDNLPDIVVNQTQRQNLYFLRNKSEGSLDFSAPQRLDVAGTINRISTADFNNDGKMDIAVTNTLQNRVDVLINTTTTTTFAFTRIPVNTSFESWGIDLGDVNGDGNVDIIVSNKNKTIIDAANLRINILLNSGATTPVFTRTDITTTSPAYNVRVNDFDGDGKPDIAITTFDIASATCTISAYRNRNCHQATILNTETAFCTPKSVRLQAIPAGNVTFAWEKDNVSTGGNTSFITITNGGTYEVTVTGESNTCITTDVIVMTKDNGNSAPATPSITTNSPVCVGQTLNLSTSNVAGAEYIWKGPNGFASSLEDPTRTSMSNANAGEYSLQLLMTASGCKSNIATTIVDVVDITDFTISSSVAGMLCTGGGSATMSVSNVANHTYQWRRNGAPTGDVGPSVTKNQDGIYTVFITNTSAGCSAETEPFELIVLDPPISSFTVDGTVCKGVPTQFTSTSDVDTRATPVYAWTFGDAQSSSEANPSHTYNPSTPPTNYTATLTVSYQSVSGCTDAENTMVSVVGAVIPTILSTSSQACPEGTVQLSVQDGLTVVQWSTSETTATIEAAPGDYTVTTTDANGCQAQGSLTIESYPSPVLLVSARRTSITAGDTTLLEVTGAESYVWSPATALADAAMATSASPIALPSATTTYIVVGTAAVADGGCTGQGEVTVTVSNPTALFPPAFSPNGDGENEEWKITGAASDCLMTIFDGRGRRIFEKKAENWDGTFNGKPVPDGTYYYVYGCPSVKPVTGTVLVFR